MKRLYPTYLFLIILFCSPACSNDTDTQDPEDGIGVEVNQEPPPGMFEDYLNTNRDVWQKPDMVIDFLGDLEGKTVADIGAGVGYFSRRLVRRADKVIAIDIEKQFIDYLDSLRSKVLPEEYRNRLEPRLAAPDNPRLREEEVDAVFIVNTYAFLPNRIQYLQKVKQGMKLGGNLLLIDFKKKNTPIGHPTEIRIPLYQVEQELQQAGFVVTMANDTALDYQYIVIAKKVKES